MSAECTQTTAARPLDGVTVVSLEHAIAAPFCTRQLADLGARVIKIERPGVGDFARGYDERVRGLSSHFVWTNRSKESLSLDLKHSEAVDILERLLVRADVLVQNLAPGAAARLGLSFNVLHAKFPRLVVCDISGYGDSGPYRDKKAYDLMIQGESAFLSVTGLPNEPVKAGISISDIAAGMYAYSGILGALMMRLRTGLGSCLDVSMLESTIEWLGYPLYYAFEGADPPVRNGALHATIYPYGLFPVGDGSSLMLGVQNEREWRTFCERVLGRPEMANDDRFASNSKRSSNRDVLHAVIVQIFATLNSQELVRRLDDAQIANAKVNELRDIWKHPQLRERARWRSVGSPVGELPALVPPGTNTAFEPRMDPIPALGEHTAQILSDIGYTAEQVAQLRELGVV